jgi:hypothetical protein
MQKKRLITGWRQVTRPKPALSPAPQGKPASNKPVAERAADERWETEGGHVETTGK